MTWLPRETDVVDPPRRPWVPSGLEQSEVGGLSYVVVDEIVGGSVGLVVSEWPRLDEQGRLRFSDALGILGAELRSMQAFLTEHRHPRGLADRPVRIGDVFAMRVNPDVLERSLNEPAQEGAHELLDPATWIEPPIHDVTREARDEAKLSFYATVAPVVPPDEATVLKALTE